MDRVFSAWGSTADIRPRALVSGEDPPRFANGELQPHCEKLFWKIEVGNYEEAASIFNLRCGFEPYRPEGPVSDCPKCGSLLYADGSGQCWNCDYVAP